MHLCSFDLPPPPEQKSRLHLFFNDIKTDQNEPSFGPYLKCLDRLFSKRKQKMGGSYPHPPMGAHWLMCNREMHFLKKTRNT